MPALINLIPDNLLPYIVITGIVLPTMGAMALDKKMAMRKRIYVLVGVIFELFLIIGWLDFQWVLSLPATYVHALSIGFVLYLGFMIGDIFFTRSRLRDAASKRLVAFVKALTPTPGNRYFVPALLLLIVSIEILMLTGAAFAVTMETIPDFYRTLFGIFFMFVLSIVGVINGLRMPIEQRGKASSPAAWHRHSPRNSCLQVRCISDTLNKNVPVKWL